MDGEQQNTNSLNLFVKIENIDLSFNLTYPRKNQIHMISNKNEHPSYLWDGCFRNMVECLLFTRKIEISDERYMTLI